MKEGSCKVYQLRGPTGSPGGCRHYCCLLAHCRAFCSLSKILLNYVEGFPGGSDSGKEWACSAGDLGSMPGLGRFPWRRERLPTPVFLPGEFRGQPGSSPWGCEGLDMTERLTRTTAQVPLLRVKCGVWN